MMLPWALVSICRLCVLQEISADLRSVSPGEIITLHCSISTDYEISWFHQNSEQQMKLLVSAARGKLDKSFHTNSSSVSLVIKGVNDTDLGLYYCGGRNYSSLLQFRKPIRCSDSLSRSHSRCLSLSHAVSSSRVLSLALSCCLSLSRADSPFIKLSLAHSCFLSLSHAVSPFLVLSLALSCCL
uniref:Ig-like domain-containing protein n=1 Tax=Astyanax mexicanus TaxID=7994 RepID=A0A3B1J4M6_ASTMX